MPMGTTVSIEDFSALDLDRGLEGLASLLHESVQQGASIGFILPYELSDSRAFWQRQVRPALLSGERILLAAKHGDDIVGAGQLNVAMPANQAHRAEVTKLIVRPSQRRLGIGRALMDALESRARQLGRGLLTLDTASEAAERLYRGQGFTVAGIIPDYARAAAEDRLEATIVMFKRL